jgi:uncharacterized sodium:solute symporter family permease YidK
MGRARRQVLRDFGVERVPFGRLCIDGRTIPKRIFKRQCQGMDWIIMAQDSSKCWALVNMVMNPWVPYAAG